MIFRPNRSATGKAISDSSLIGTPSPPFSGGRRMVKWTRSTLASDFNRLRHMRSPGMRLARDEQHAQLVAHAVDVDDGAVAIGRSVRRHRRDLEFDDIDAGVLDRRLHVDRSPTSASIVSIVSPSRRTVELDRLAVIGAVEDARGDRLVLADDAVARRLDQLDPALALALVAGDQGVQRRVEAERGRGSAGMSWTSPSVIMNAPPTRSGGASASASRSAANSRVPSVSDSSREVSTTRRSTSPSALRRASTSSRALSVWPARSPISLALRAVDDDRDDILERAAVLLHEPGIAQAQKREAEGERSQPGAARPAPDERDRRSPAPRRRARKGPKGDQRGETDRPGRHRVSLSMMSLAWTWSAL